MLRRRTLLLTAAATMPFGLAVTPASRAAPAPALSAQDQADITRIEAYLNGLKTLKAHFTQGGPGWRCLTGHRLGGAAGPDAVPV